MTALPTTAFSRKQKLSLRSDRLSALDDAQIQRLWEAFFDERDPDKLRDAVRKLNQMLQERTKSFEDQPPQKQEQRTGL